MSELKDVIAAIARNVQWSQHQPEDQQIVQDWLESQGSDKVTKGKTAGG
jgi:hypothetical protein